MTTTLFHNGAEDYLEQGQSGRDRTHSQKREEKVTYSVGMYVTRLRDFVLDPKCGLSSCIEMSLYELQLLLPITFLNYTMV